MRGDHIKTHLCMASYSRLEKKTRGSTDLAAGSKEGVPTNNSLWPAREVSKFMGKREKKKGRNQTLTCVNYTAKELAKGQKQRKANPPSDGEREKLFHNHRLAGAGTAAGKSYCGQPYGFGGSSKGEKKRGGMNDWCPGDHLWST